MYVEALNSFQGWVFRHEFKITQREGKDRVVCVFVISYIEIWYTAAISRKSNGKQFAISEKRGEILRNKPRPFKCSLLQDQEKSPELQLVPRRTELSRQRSYQYF